MLCIGAHSSIYGCFSRILQHLRINIDSVTSPTTQTYIYRDF